MRNKVIKVNYKYVFSNAFAEKIRKGVFYFAHLIVSLTCRSKILLLEKTNKNEKKILFVWFFAHLIVL